MKLQITALEQTGALQLVGDLDIYSVESARDALLTHLTRNSGLELDLGGVETCDAAGLQLLLSAKRSAAASGKSFAIHTPAPAIDKCGELLGLAPESRPGHTN